MTRSRWFWLPGVTFAVLVAPLISPWLPAVVMGDDDLSGGFFAATAVIAATLTYAVARWQLANRVEAVCVAALGAAASLTFIVAAWSGVS